MRRYNLFKFGKKAVKTFAVGAAAGAGVVAGAAMLGKKLVDMHKDKIDALSDNIEEGVHTAGEVLNQASSVTGIRSGVEATGQSIQELSGAHQYQKTRRDAARAGVQMDTRPVHQAEARQHNRQQRANVDEALRMKRERERAKCLGDASKLKNSRFRPKRRENAEAKCNEKFGGFRI